MKKFILPLLVLTSLLVTPGCSEKFNTAAPYKNITVIYGFLDMADTAHYVRIQKAFLDQNKSAIDMSKVADSSFYASLNVRVETIDYSGNKVSETQLTRVDLNQEGYPKQEGAFFNTPNYAYKFKDVLDGKYMYRLKVTNSTTGETDSAETPMIDDLHSKVFNIDVLDDTDINRAGMDFGSTLPFKNFEFFIQYATPANFNFHGQASPVSVGQGFIRFNYADSDMLTGAKTIRYGDYNLPYKPLNVNQIDYKVLDNDLYHGVRAALGKAPANTARLMSRAEVHVYMATADYYNYYQTSLIQGTGLTGNDIQPIYTNIKGANVLGLFTSRGHRSGLITITGSTIDSLVSNPIMADINIKGTLYH